jgi:hypothetical protein
VVCLLAGAVVFACTFASASWDASESRNNSFSKADESALKQIQSPLRIDVHLAPEDPRRFDLEQRALSKLRRIMPRLEVRYLSNTSIGLFEQTNAGYGEIWYHLGGRNMMSRATTEEAVLETIYSLANVAPPKESDEAIFRGHPLAAPPRGAGAIFYVCWPALFLVSGILMRWRLR